MSTETTERPKMASSFEIRRTTRGDYTVYADDKPFPWHVAREGVRVRREGPLALVTLTIMVDGPASIDSGALAGDEDIIRRTVEEMSGLGLSVAKARDFAAHVEAENARLTAALRTTLNPDAQQADIEHAREVLEEVEG